MYIRTYSCELKNGANPIDRILVLMRHARKMVPFEWSDPDFREYLQDHFKKPVAGTYGSNFALSINEVETAIANSSQNKDLKIALLHSIRQNPPLCTNKQCQRTWDFDEGECHWCGEKEYTTQRILDEEKKRADKLAIFGLAPSGKPKAADSDKKIFEATSSAWAYLYREGYLTWTGSCYYVEAVPLEEECFDFGGKYASEEVFSAGSFLVDKSTCKQVKNEHGDLYNGADALWYIKNHTNSLRYFQTIVVDKYYLEDAKIHKPK